MTTEELVEELKCLMSWCYIKRCLLWLIAQPWPLTTFKLHLFSHLLSWALLRLHFGMSLRFRSGPLQMGRGFYIHILFGTIGIASSLSCLQSPWHDHGNKQGLVGDMGLDQDVQNVLVWPDSILRAVLFIRLTTEEGKWGNCQKKKKERKQLIFSFGGYL